MGLRMLHYVQKCPCPPQPFSSMLGWAISSAVVSCLSQYCRASLVGSGSQVAGSGLTQIGDSGVLAQTVAQQPHTVQAWMVGAQNRPQVDLVPIFVPQYLWGRYCLLLLLDIMVQA